MKYILVPGSGGRAWYWHRVVPELRQAGHEAVAVELPAGDDSAGLAEYRDAIADAFGVREEAIVVAQSMAGFSAPLVCDRRNVRMLVLVNAMVPKPGETMSDWWSNTGYADARTYPDFDVERDFFHDVPARIKAEAFASGEPAQSEKPWNERWPLKAWPTVETRVVQGRDDRFFPLEFQRRIARERLGIALDEMPGGHLLALSRPVELAAKLDGYARAR